MNKRNESGRVGYLVLYLMGVPIGLLAAHVGIAGQQHLQSGLRRGRLPHANRPGIAPVRARSARPLRRDGARRVVSDRGARRARPRRHAVRQRRLADPGAARTRVRARPAARSGGVATRWPCTSACSTRVYRRGRPVRHHPLPHRLPRSSRSPGTSRRRPCSRCTVGSTCPTWRRSTAEFPDVPLVSISAAQRSPLPDATWVATVHHGLPGALYHFRATHRRLPCCSSAASRRRSARTRAIAIARAAGMPLKIAAKVDPRRPGLFRARRAPASRRIRWSSSSARSTTRARLPCSAARARCSFPSTGPSRSGWS